MAPVFLIRIRDICLEFLSEDLSVPVSIVFTTGERHIFFSETLLSQNSYSLSLKNPSFALPDT